ncbi:MAG: late competence development ComFB family protein [Clostridiales Family XIII bacterium]|jgi:competence protein ComFB|nr:late competence development ComFB family protein [Clostridiales Family XIII bacterium]
MARRNNKTEHVMKLITKDSGGSDSAADVSDAPASPENQEAPETQEAPDVPDARIDADRVEASVKAPKTNELNYKTKLKIEIEPEIEVKEPVHARQPKLSAERAEAPVRSPQPAEERTFADAEPDGAEAAREPSPQEIPDGTPYEKLDEEIMPRGRPFMGARSLSEEERLLEQEAQYASIKSAEQRRARKIQIESALLNKSRNLINLSEILTKELLPSVMEKMEVCVCPVCTANVLALALNTLPTRYVTSDVGKQYTQLEVYKKQYELDVLLALTKACLRVKQTPRHEIIDDLYE